MKKLIVVLLISVLILSVAACGKKAVDNKETLPVSNGSSVQSPEDTATSADDLDAEGSASSEAPEQDSTKPAEDSNKVDTTVPVDPEKPADKNEDIKVEINNDSNGNGSGNGDVTTVTPPDSNSSDFVIDFDDLMSASKK